MRTVDYCRISWLFLTISGFVFFLISVYRFAERVRRHIYMRNARQGGSRDISSISRGGGASLTAPHITHSHTLTSSNVISLAVEITPQASTAALPLTTGEQLARTARGCVLSTVWVQLKSPVKASLFGRLGL